MKNLIIGIVVGLFTAVLLIWLIAVISNRLNEPFIYIKQEVRQFNDSIYAVETNVIKYYRSRPENIKRDTFYVSRIGSYENFLGQVLVNEYQKAESILFYFRDKELVNTYQDESGKIVIDTIRFKNLK